MKLFPRLIAVTLVLALPACSKFPSKEKVLTAIEIFCNAPLSPEGKAAGNGIAGFYGDPKSTNYAHVALFPEFMPGSGEAQPENVKKAKAILLTASLAGNLRVQLKENVIANHPYEGILQMIETYAKLQAADPTLHLPKVDNFVALEREKLLKNYVDDVIKKKNYPVK
jgi:hypothetical protein